VVVRRAGGRGVVAAAAAVMPRLHAAAAGRVPDDAEFASTDEVIVYEDEGDADDDARSGRVENLTEEKLGLLTETEQVPA